MTTRLPRLVSSHAAVCLTAAWAVAGCLSLSAAEDAAGWQQVGWGGGAFYYAAAWHPTEAGVIYMGGDCNGAYRTDDKAEHWTLANSGIAGYGVFSLAVSPAAPDLVYVLTEDGLCKSTDRAKTWQMLPASAPGKLNICATKSGTVRAVAIDPQHADTVYAGSRSGSLFKTTDGGATWTELPYRDALPKDPAVPAFSGSGALRLNYASDSGTMDSMGRVSHTFGQGKAARDWSAYATFSAQLQTPADAPVLQASLVIQSGDKWQWQQGPWLDLKPGAWSEITYDLKGLQGLDSVRMIHVVLRSPNAAYKGDVLLDSVAVRKAAADGAAPETSVIADWEKPGDADGWSANRQFADSLHITGAKQSHEKRGGDVVSGVAVSANAVYVSSTRYGVFRSDDAGGTWVQLPTPKKVESVTVSPSDAQVVWAACGTDGLRRSKDRGQSWEMMSSALSAKVAMREVALHPAKPELVYAIGNEGWGGHLYRSDDAGATWTTTTKVTPSAPGNPTNPAETACSLSTSTSIALNPKNPDEFFIAANWRNIFSADGGKTLVERSTGADNTCTTDIQFLGAKTYVTAMDEGLLSSDNGGKDWKQLWPLKYEENTSGHFWRVRAIPNGSSVRIVTTCSPWKSFGDPKCISRVFYSEDDGATFHLTTAGLPDYVPNVNCMWGRSFPRSLAVDPKNPEILYLGMDGDPEPAKKLPGGGIFRSTDSGKTWVRCASQPGGLRLYYGLVVDPTDSNRLFFSSCGTGGGAWRSEDAGATWQHVFSTESWCFNLEISAAGNVLVGGKDLWRSTDHGKTFQKLTNFSGDPTIVGIATDPADEKRFWLARTTWSGAADGGVYRTVDGGATWQDITGDIPFRKPQLLRYNPQTKLLWAGGVGLYTLQQ